MTEATSGLENKATGGIDALFGEFMTAFEEFKRSNDTRLTELRRDGDVPDAEVTAAFGAP